MTATDHLNSPWRKTAATIYKKPQESKIIGSVELDVTELNAYIQKKRQSGIKLTPTHVFTLAVARAIAQEIPAMNTYVRRGQIVAFEQIDAMVSVLLQGGQMGSVKLENADQLTLDEAVVTLGNKIKQARRQKDENAGSKQFISRVPWPLRAWIFKLVRLMTIRWGIPLPGLAAHEFGSFVVSNIGSLGLEVGYPALFPVGQVSFVLLLGGSREKPWVVDGEITIRTIMNVSIAMDHRMLDASHGGQLFRYLKRMVKEPGLLEE